MIKKSCGTISILACLLLLFPALLLAEDLPLYNATVGQVPEEQSWLTYFADGTTTQQAITDGVLLQTDLITTHAGYSNYDAGTQSFKNPLFPVLDRNKGVILRFELQLNSENHASVDRAGFSVILLDSDRKGVEISFWENEIWAQTDDPLFTHGESVDFVTTGRMKSYILTLDADSYSLYEGSTQILTGAIKDYSDFSGFPDPYELPNYLFLGDDTTSAGSEIILGTVLLQSDTHLKIAFPWYLFLPAICR